MGTSITFHGGVQDIGGNKFLVKDKDTTLLMDFGMSFTAEGNFFSEFMKARGSNELADMFALGILPKIKGMYRRDYAKHVGFGGKEDTEIDGLLLTHAHVDHCAYIKYLREDIPIHCSEASKLIMQNFDDTGIGEQYLTLKEKFKLKEGKKGGLTRAKGDEVAIPRTIKLFESGKEFSIDSIRVKPMPVDHSLPGVHAFILHTSSGSVGNTGDLRYHGRRKGETEAFVEECGRSDLGYLLCEGTRVDASSSLTEYGIEESASEIIKNTDGLAICGYPVRDLDRLQSFYLAAKKANRRLVIDMKQAYLLNLFDGSANLKGSYPSPTDRDICVYIPKGSWGLIDKDRSEFPKEQLLQDYSKWQRDFLDYPNAVDYRDVQKAPKDFLFFCNDFKLQELIDIEPGEGTTYIRSLTEPFNDEMALREDLVKNWFVHFNILKKDEDWHHLHVSGHGDGAQIQKVIEGARSKKLIPIHTLKEEYHKKWHNNVISVNQHGTIDL